MVTNLKCIQANIGRGYTTTVNLIELAKQEKARVLAIQEPYTYEKRVIGIPNTYDLFSGASASRPKAALTVDKRMKAIGLEEFTNDFMPQQQ